MPSTLDMPEIEVILAEEPDLTGPFGARGMGEPGMTNVAPAIANALYDAVGVRIHSLPVTLVSTAVVYEIPVTQVLR
jgi:CO/xanthine dehydrogenase Mo-binding subunit